MDNIYLVGYMGAGKSTIGKALAQSVPMDFVDLDDIIEERSGLTIPDIFDRYGEERFRLLEASAVHQTMYLDGYVIATGGGAPCYHDNMGIMKESGAVIYLKGSAALLLQRIEKDQQNIRPILQEMPSDERRTFISRHLQRREPYYNLADKVIDIAQSTDEIINEIMGYKKDIEKEEESV